MATTDPLAKRIDEARVAKEAVEAALGALLEHMHEYGCVRSDLINELADRHNRQLNIVMGR